MKIKKKVIFSYNATLCWVLAFTWMLLWHVPPTLPQTNYAPHSATETWRQWFILQDSVPRPTTTLQRLRHKEPEPDLNRLRIHEMHTKLNPWRPHLATHRTQRMSATNCQAPQDIPRGTMSDWAMAEQGRGRHSIGQVSFMLLWLVYFWDISSQCHNSRILFVQKMALKHVTQCYFSAVQSERTNAGTCDMKITHLNFCFSVKDICLHSFCKCNISLGFDHQNPSSAWMESFVLVENKCYQVPAPSSPMLVLYVSRQTTQRSTVYDFLYFLKEQSTVKLEIRDHRPIRREDENGKTARDQLIRVTSSQLGWLSKWWFCQ